MGEKVGYSSSSRRISFLQDFVVPTHFQIINFLKQVNDIIKIITAHISSSKVILKKCVIYIGKQNEDEDQSFYFLLTQIYNFYFNFYKTEKFTLYTPGSWQCRVSRKEVRRSLSSRCFYGCSFLIKLISRLQHLSHQKFVKLSHGSQSAPVRFPSLMTYVRRFSVILLLSESFPSSLPLLLPDPSPRSCVNVPSPFLPVAQPHHHSR